ncbi:MAG: hypothetical protein KGL39_21335 [Patescibacteria group bacterium]|nr:hypothetical protein [Patescibacteria group bacterium]
MSNFVTTLKVDLQSVISALPQGAFVDSITWNPALERLEVAWQHDDLETGLTVATEFPQEDLKRKLLPKGAKMRVRGQAVTTAVPKVKVDGMDGVAQVDEDAPPVPKGKQRQKNAKVSRGPKK